MNPFHMITEDLFGPSSLLLEFPDTVRAVYEMGDLQEPGRISSVKPARLRIIKRGFLPDFRMAHNIPVVSLRLAELMEEWFPEEVQRVPTRIRGLGEPYEILRPTRYIPCLDPEQSRYYENAHGEPELQLPAINATAAGDANLFRLAEDQLKFHVIASESLRQKFVDHEITGARFFTLPTRRL